MANAPRTLHVRLFQASIKTPYVFRSLAEAQRLGGVDPKDYRLVYQEDRPVGSMAQDEVVLEQLYTRYNADDRPGAHEFRSLSMSDLVELSGPDGTRLWYCDAAGFKKLDLTMP